MSEFYAVIYNGMSLYKTHNSCVIQVQHWFSVWGKIWAKICL